MDIDVRKGAEVDKILFGQGTGHISLSNVVGQLLLCNHEESDGVYISIEDIPNLIKALQKAQEMWGEK